MAKEKPSMEELERMFDEGVDVAQYADYSDRPGLRQRRVGVDMPLAMIDRLDARASAAGVARLVCFYRNKVYEAGFSRVFT